MIGPFTYPGLSHHRRHGPLGCTDAESYRPWLRDEFAFRCAYCLKREQWGRPRGTFGLAHFQPIRYRPDLAPTYDNLVYACATCTAARGGQEVHDPCRVLLNANVRVHEDGSIVAESAGARRLIRALGLDDPEYTEFRFLWLNVAQLAKRYDPELYQQLMGFPADLPNLGPIQPPEGNSRPEGIEDSYFRQRERGTLPASY